MNERFVVSIVDDHYIVAKGIADLLATNDQFALGEMCESVNEFLSSDLSKRTDILLLDIALGEESSLARIEEILATRPELKVVVCSMYDSDAYVIGARRHGAVGFISKGRVHKVLMDVLKAVIRGETCFPETREASSASGSTPRLSPREKEVLRLLALDHQPKEIAQILDCATKTVHAHIANIGVKLEARDRATWIKYALSEGIISPGDRSF